MENSRSLEDVYAPENYDSKVQFYAESIEKLIGNAKSGIREVSSDNLQQVQTDLLSLKQYIERTTFDPKDRAVYQNRYDDLVEKRDLTIKMMHHSQAA